MATHTRRAGLLALLAALSAAGCQSVETVRERTFDSLRSVVTSTYHDDNAEQKFASAMELFQAANYSKAQDIFADLADNQKNPALLAEKARFHEAECLRERQQLPAAAATYHRLLKDHPQGAYRERACHQMYAIAYGWLETETLAEIEAEQGGARASWWEKPFKLPNVLDSKKPLFDTEGEALEVLDHVQTHDIVGPNADRALFWLGYVHYYRGRFEEADHYFSQLVEFHKDSKLRPAALKLAIIAKNNATGGPDYDSTKAAEALQLIHQAEATMPGVATDPGQVEEMGKRKVEVRSQLAQKYLRRAEYYERTHRPGSAYFYYDLVVRQHSGTRYAEHAAQRLQALEVVRQDLELKRANPPEPGVFESLRDRFLTATGQRPSLSESGTPPEPPDQGPPTVTPYAPAGPAGAPPGTLPPGVGVRPR